MMKMNIFRKVSCPAQMLAMFTMVACVDQTVQEVESDTELITTEDLSFTNFEEIEVNVSLSDGQKEPVSGALVKFYDASNLLEGAEIIKGLTGADGSFSMAVLLRLAASSNCWRIISREFTLNSDKIWSLLL